MPTWSSGTDWDAATSESGVAHENVTNTDHTDAGQLIKGYDYENFGEIAPTPVVCWPLHEDSGSTANDVAGTYDGTYTNINSLGDTGILGTTSPTFPSGTNDGHINLPNIGDPEQVSEITITMWVNFDTLAVNHADGEMFMLSFGEAWTDYVSIGAVSNNADNGLLCHVENRNSSGSASTEGEFRSSTNIPTGEWRFLAMVYNGNDPSLIGYIDGVQDDSTTNLPTLTPNATDYRIGINGDWASAARFFEGRMGDVRLYTTALTQTQIQTLYDVVDTTGQLTTDYR